MDVMIVKSSQEESRDQHLWKLFKRVWQYNMRLSPYKCTFGVRVNKFLGYYLRDRGIALNKFISKSS